MRAGRLPDPGPLSGTPDRACPPAPGPQASSGPGGRSTHQTDGFEPERPPAPARLGA